MPRYALKIEYHGAPFAGWQRQSQGLASVQGAIEEALAKLEPRAHTIAAAGRTDAGVHATGQVAHCDLTKDWDPFRLASALNAHLRPHPVSVLAVVPVDDEFHARFSARERRYLFRLVARRAPATHDRGQVWRVHSPLDIDAMRAGAAGFFQAPEQVPTDVLKVFEGQLVEFADERLPGWLRLTLPVVLSTMLWSIILRVSGLIG